jgi:hypothetical protein
MSRQFNPNPRAPIDAATVTLAQILAKCDDFYWNASKWEARRIVRINAIFSGIRKYSTTFFLVFPQITAKSHRNFAASD